MEGKPADDRSVLHQLTMSNEEEEETKSGEEREEEKVGRQGGDLLLISGCATRRLSFCWIYTSQGETNETPRASCVTFAVGYERCEKQILYSL